MNRRSFGPGWVLPAALLLTALGALVALRLWTQRAGSPVWAVDQFARAVYARDYATAWEWIAEGDQRLKTREAYLAENASFDGLRLDLAYQLSEWIEFTEVSYELHSTEATLTAYVRVPNGNQAQVVELLQAAEQATELSDQRQADLITRLRELYQRGELEFLEGEETFRLVREGLNWRVRMDWERAIRVQLIAQVEAGLEWDFYPLQEEVLALPGETLTATYRAINRSDQVITGKAKHELLPDEYETYITTIQCFCFIQQTLAPGESRDMNLIFRIAYDVPEHVRAFENLYVFYPIESFPDG